MFEGNRSYCLTSVETCRCGDGILTDSAQIMSDIFPLPPSANWFNFSRHLTCVEVSARGRQVLMTPLVWATLACRCAGPNEGHTYWLLLGVVRTGSPLNTLSPVLFRSAVAVIVTKKCNCNGKKKLNKVNRSSSRLIENVSYN